MFVFHATPLFLDDCQAEIQVEQVAISSTLSIKENEQPHRSLPASHTCHRVGNFSPWQDVESLQLSQFAEQHFLSKGNRIHWNLT